MCRPAGITSMYLLLPVHTILIATGLQVQNSGMQEVCHIHHTILKLLQSFMPGIPEDGHFLITTRLIRCAFLHLINLILGLTKDSYFKKWSLMLYLDIQNLYNFQSEKPDIVVREKEMTEIISLITDDDGLIRYDLDTIPSSRELYCQPLAS